MPPPAEVRSIVRLLPNAKPEARVRKRIRLPTRIQLRYNLPEFIFFSSERDRLRGGSVCEITEGIN
jgi:hypothetical protein